MPRSLSANGTRLCSTQAQAYSSCRSSSDGCWFVIFGCGAALAPAGPAAADPAARIVRCRPVASTGQQLSSDFSSPLSDPQAFARARASAAKSQPSLGGGEPPHLTSRLLAREPRTEHSHVSIRLHSAPYPSRAARANRTMTARVCNILSQPNSWLPCTAHEYVPHATSARRPPPTGC